MSLGHVSHGENLMRMPATYKKKTGLPAANPLVLPIVDNVRMWRSGVEGERQVASGGREYLKMRLMGGRRREARGTNSWGIEWISKKGLL